MNCTNMVLVLPKFDFSLRFLCKPDRQTVMKLHTQRDYLIQINMILLCRQYNEYSIDQIGCFLHNLILYFYIYIYNNIILRIRLRLIMLPKRKVIDQITQIYDQESLQLVAHSTKNVCQILIQKSQFQNHVKK